MTKLSKIQTAAFNNMSVDWKTAADLEINSTTLRSLETRGLVERRKEGRGFEWRLVPVSGIVETGTAKPTPPRRHRPMLIKMLSTTAMINNMNVATIRNFVI